MNAPPPGSQRLLASLPLAVVLVAPDRTVAGANPAAEQALGQGEGRLLGRPVDALLGFEDDLAGHLGEDDARLYARGSRVTIAGSSRSIDVMLAPVAGHPGWRMIILHEPIGVESLGGEGAGDASPLRAPEILAHEIKNPLAGIRGAAQLLARDAGTRQRQLTALIVDEVDRVTRLVDQMQALGRKSHEALRPCNVHEALRQAVAVFESSAGEGFRVEEAFDPSLPPVLGSPDALVQVVLNLLDNAREACAGETAPRIILRTRFASGIRLHDAPGRPPLALPIEVRVSDNGPGVAAELCDHIFEPFVTDKPRGQGLGLALVQKLVREMRGRITFDREEAAGLTHFRLHLPVAEAGAGRVDEAAAA